MLDAIQSFFRQHLSPTDAPRDTEHRLHLATAALLFETMRSDADLDEREREHMLRALREHAGLTDAEAAELAALAEAESKQATDFFQFTSLINRHYGQAEKNAVVEMMWRVAYADGEISAHERHLLRRIADLLHVRHPEFVAAQRRARGDD